MDGHSRHAVRADRPVRRPVTRGPSLPATAIAILLTVLLAAIPVARPGAQVHETTLELSAASDGSANPATNVSVRLAGGTTVNAFDIVLEFPASTLSPVDLDTSLEGLQLVIDSRWTTVVRAEVDEAAGTVRVAAASLASGCDSTSPCPLFSVTWRALMPGDHQVRVASASLASGADVLADPPANTMTLTSRAVAEPSRTAGTGAPTLTGESLNTDVPGRDAKTSGDAFPGILTIGVITGVALGAIGILVGRLMIPRWLGRTDTAYSDHDGLPDVDTILDRIEALAGLPDDLDDEATGTRSD